MHLARRATATATEGALEQAADARVGWPMTLAHTWRLAAPAGASLALVTACAGTHPAAESVPTELDTRDAYLDTPVITSVGADRVVLGTPRRAVARSLGVSHVGYRRAGRECTLYPIIGTQRRDRVGSPVADEWEFCFDASGRLAVKTLVRNDADGAR